MKQRVWLVPSKSFQKAWSPSQVREAISLGPIFHFRFLLLRASADSLVIAIGKCDLWKNEACRSTNRVCRCLSPALCFQWQKWLSIIHPCFFSPGARSSTFHRHLVEFYLIVPSRDSQWNSLLMERKGNVIPILCYFSMETHKEELCLLSIHLFPFLKFSKFNQPEQICVIIFELMVLEFS